MSKILIKYILVCFNKIQSLSQTLASVSLTSLPGGMGGVKVKPQQSDLVAGHSGDNQHSQHTEEQDEGP